MEWPDFIVEELVRCGVDMFYIAPGSRSTPLVCAIARNNKTFSCIHFDERGTAFATLGYARANGKPAAWITTSGTAVANGFPAVIEASVDGVSMILITADRPSELRDTGANQTIIQSAIFGEYVRWNFELPVSEAQVDPAFVLTTVDQAVHRAVAEMGPVHLNCMFRKPLESGRSVETGRLPVHLSNWINSTLPYTTYAPSSRIVSDRAVETLRAFFTASKRPVVVLGRVLDSSYEKSIVEWAAAEKIPVMPDISSGFRLQHAKSSRANLSRSDSSVIPYWDLLLSTHGDGNDFLPDLIVQFGRGTVSSHFDTGSAKRVVIDSAPDRFDPGHRVALRIQADSRGVTDLVGRLYGVTSDTGSWLSFWQNKNEAVTHIFSDWMEAEADTLSEESVAHILPSSCGIGNMLVLGNSLCVRHVNRFASPGEHKLTTIINRGASGIDGTVAMGTGAAAGTAGAAGTTDAAGTANRVIVFLGDQSLLHDLNSLAMANGAGLIVVVVNNNGGRIFHRLPVSAHEDIFERYFVGPHGYSFKHAASLFNIRYEAPGSVRAFERVLQNSLQEDGATLIEIKIDFEENEIRRLKLLDRFSVALSDKSHGTDREESPRSESS